MGNVSMQLLLRCIWNGVYPLPTLHWTERSRSLGDREPVLNVSQTGESLEVKLNRSQLRDGQELRCTGHHPALEPKDYRSCSVTLKAPYPQGDPLVTAFAGKNVVLKCTETESIPPANTTWLKTIRQEKIIPSSKYIISQDGPVFTLTIVNCSKEEDEGVYFCRSENPISVQELEVYLTIKSSASNAGGVIGTFIAVLIVAAGIVVGVIAYSNRDRICLGHSFGNEERSDVLNLVDSDEEELFNDSATRITAVANGHATSLVQIHHNSPGHLLFNLTEHRDVVRDLTFAPNGGLILVSGSRDKTLRIWDLTKDRKKAHVLTGHGNWVYSCCISPDCSIVASVCGHNQVYLWSLRSYTFIRYLEGKHCLISCDFSPDGALLITAAFSKELILWDPYTGEALRKLSHCFSPEYFPPPPDVTMRAVRFSPEGLYFASVAEDRAVRIWALGIDSPVMENCYTGVHVSNGLCCAFHPQGGVVATGTRDGYVQFWSTPRIVPSLRHLSRVSLRHSVSTYQVMALPIPNKMKDFLTYRTLARCHERSELHHLQDVVSLN
ncbi:WSB2 protein, partial [Atractosteus spatula]|nr:WSB2 protein [Atractosteus spatula]